jgi:hypothetical protein
MMQQCHKQTIDLKKGKNYSTVQIKSTPAKRGSVFLCVAAAWLVVLGPHPLALCQTPAHHLLRH